MTVKWVVGTGHTAACPQGPVPRTPRACIWVPFPHSRELTMGEDGDPTTADVLQEGQRS